MSLVFAPQDAPLYYRVFHPHFDRSRAYPLVAISDHAETAPARLWFHTDAGWLWAVDQRRCILVCGERSRPLTDAQAASCTLPRTKPKSDFA